MTVIQSLMPLPALTWEDHIKNAEAAIKDARESGSFADIEMYERLISRIKQHLAKQVP